jgi:hypothetical protein
MIHILPNDLAEMRLRSIILVARLTSCFRGTFSKSAGSLFLKSWPKYHLSDDAAICTDQWVGHQWHHTTHLRQRYVGNCFRHFRVDYHNPINGSFWYCWLHRGYNEPLHFNCSKISNRCKSDPCVRKHYDISDSELSLLLSPAILTSILRG